MPNTIGKNLNLCFTKTPTSPESSSNQEEDHSRPLSTATTTTTTSILFKNFNSLYDFTLDCTTNSKSFAHSTSTSTSTAADDASSSESDEEPATTPDFATVFASQRFFFSSPGRSNSIIDSSSMSSSIASTSSFSPETDTLVTDSIAVPTYSPDPFMDFRRSMQEMVEARDLIDVRANWDYLHELLMCYLTLNPKSTHKFIIGAFADLLVSLMTSDDRRKSLFSDESCKLSRRSM